MTIFTLFDPEIDRHEIWVSSKGMSPAPAGPRLFRASPHPNIQFTHETAEAANKDAEKLRAYIANLTPKKQSKRELREVGA